MLLSVTKVIAVVSVEGVMFVVRRNREERERKKSELEFQGSFGHFMI